MCVRASSNTVRLENRPQSAQVSSSSRPLRSSIGENSRMKVQNVLADSPAQQLSELPEKSLYERPLQSGERAVLRIAIAPAASISIVRPARPHVDTAGIVGPAGSVVGPNT